MNIWVKIDMKACFAAGIVPSAGEYAPLDKIGIESLSPEDRELLATRLTPGQMGTGVSPFDAILADVGVPTWEAVVKALPAMREKDAERKASLAKAANEVREAQEKQIALVLSRRAAEDAAIAAVVADRCRLARTLFDDPALMRRGKYIDYVDSRIGDYLTRNGVDASAFFSTLHADYVRTVQLRDDWSKLFEIATTAGDRQ